MWFFYVDDSGDQHRILLSAVAVPVDRWNECLSHWLDWRRKLYREHSVPAGFELHAGHFVIGRGRPAGTPPDGFEPPVNTSKALRRRLYRSGLETIAGLPARIMTVHRSGTDKMAAYRELRARVERQLAEWDTVGVLVVDGLDEGHRAEHRELPLTSRRVIEDPWMQPSHHSQFIQIADLTVHTAFQALVRNPAREFMWSWYADVLGPVVLRDLDDVLGEQQEA